MNIFILDTDPAESARLHCDRHVVKMPPETAQILCTALRIHGVEFGYKPTHESHPCTLWAAESRANFLWLVRLGIELVAEHGIRYAHTKAGQRGHSSKVIIRGVGTMGHAIQDGPLTPFVQAMPDRLRGPDPVEAYRRYYREEKSAIATWRSPRTRPTWMD